MGAVGGIAAALFGVFWCIAAAAMGAWFMIPFGLIFIGMAVYGAKYDYHNATSEDRYSIIDIVNEDEEIDPLNEKYGRKVSANQASAKKEKKLGRVLPIAHIVEHLLIQYLTSAQNAERNSLTNIRGGNGMKIAVLHGQKHHGSTWNVTRLLLDLLISEDDEYNEFS